MSYIESFLLGVSLAAIPGPIFFEVFRRTLSKGFWSGALLSVGEFLANIGILMLTFFGVQGFLLYQPVRMAMFLLGGVILLWIGVNALRANEKYVETASESAVSGNNSVAAGFGLAIASPLAVAVWISIGGAYLAQYSSRAVSFLNIVLLAFGVMFFFFSMACVIHFTRHMISTKYIIWFSRIFGVVLLGYGAYFLYQFGLLL